VLRAIMDISARAFSGQASSGAAGSSLQYPCSHVRRWPRAAVTLDSVTTGRVEMCRGGCTRFPSSGVTGLSKLIVNQCADVLVGHHLGRVIDRVARFDGPSLMTLQVWLLAQCSAMATSDAVTSRVLEQQGRGR
jgi:hypothetical protein